MLVHILRMEMETNEERFESDQFMLNSIIFGIHTCKEDTRAEKIS